MTITNRRKIVWALYFLFWRMRRWCRCLGPLLWCTSQVKSIVGNDLLVDYLLVAEHCKKWQRKRQGLRGSLKCSSWLMVDLCCKRIVSCRMIIWLSFALVVAMLWRRSLVTIHLKCPIVFCCFLVGSVLPSPTISLVVKPKTPFESHYRLSNDQRWHLWRLVTVAISVVS